MTVRLILARAANGVIGKDNALPWQLPEDMAHFRKATRGSSVIMGRKTWDSLPPRFRPLPERRNIVVTHQAAWLAPGALRASSLMDAIHQCPADQDVWIIGGAQIYAQAMPLAQSALVTEIHQNFDGDAFAPQFGPQWREIARETHLSANGLAFSFIHYTRTGA